MALYSSYFYHSLTRKYTDLFGALFSKLYVVRRDSNGSENHRVLVPIEYVQKEKYYRRNVGDPIENKPIAITYPLMSFELTGLFLDTERKQSATIMRLTKVNVDDKTATKTMYNGVPYNFNFTLYLAAKSVDEGNQVMEQIISQFCPDWIETLNIIPEMGVKLDVPIILNNVSTFDNNDGDLESNRLLTWQFDFTMKGYYFGPVRNAKIIREIDVNFINKDNHEQKFGTITITPVSTEVPPIDVDDITRDDPYGYDIQIDENVND